MVQCAIPVNKVNTIHRKKKKASWLTRINEREKNSNPTMEELIRQGKA